MQDILFAALVLKMSKIDDMAGGQAEVGNCTKRIPFRGNHRSRITLLAWLLVTSFSLRGPGLEAEKSPSRGAPPSGGHKGPSALITTEKHSPDKAERQMVLTDSGIPREQWKNYVVEYRIPIELGGSNSLSNIEVLLKSESPAKRRLQQSLKKQLHDRKISENEAQQRILNWRQDSAAGAPQAARP